MAHALQSIGKSTSALLSCNPSSAEGMILRAISSPASGAQWYLSSSVLSSASLLRARRISSLSISKRVKNALDNNLPVVCLESTIITHGMEYPANLRMARAVEKVIEDNGATPATIAVLNGVPHIGLEDTDLEFLARTGRQARKISRRDMAACIADTATGGTTVSATMILAKKAGIKVFVTGGIGGVHREAESTMDVSNDLNELSRNDVAVVCAGPKAILDIPRTLEYLETMGVTVTTIGQNNLPAFYSADSGICSPQVSPTPEHAARLIAANQELQLGSAVLCCVPIPANASIDTHEMRLVIDAALAKAKSFGINGKDTTPFLLAAVSEATRGRSLEANISLVMENARVGAQIAVHLQTLLQQAQDVPHQESNRKVKKQSEGRLSSQDSQRIADALSELEAGLSFSTPRDDTDSPPQSKASSRILKSNATEVLVIGGVAVDITCHIDAAIDDLKAVMYTSMPGKVTRTIGGVAGNIARAISASQAAVTLVSAIGCSKDRPSTSGGPEMADIDGEFILRGLQACGLESQISIVPEARSATYTAVQARGELLLAVADMDILSSGLSALKEMDISARYKAIVFDANIPRIVDKFYGASLAAPIVCYEPTSVTKARAIFRNSVPLPMWPANIINTTTPNIHELASLFGAAQSDGVFEQEQWWEVINALNIAADFRMQVEQFLRTHKQVKHNLSELGVIQQAIHLLPLFQNIYLTLGSSGVLSFHLSKDPIDGLQQASNILIQKGHDCILYIVYHGPLEVTAPILSDTGAGDTFTGVLVASLIKDLGILNSVKHAQRAAILTLESSESVSPRLPGLFA